MKLIEFLLNQGNLTSRLANPGHSPIKCGNNLAATNSAKAPDFENNLLGVLKNLLRNWGVMTFLITDLSRSLVPERLTHSLAQPKSSPLWGRLRLSKLRTQFVGMESSHFLLREMPRNLSESTEYCEIDFF